MQLSGRQQSTSSFPKPIIKKKGQARRPALFPIVFLKSLLRSRLMHASLLFQCGSLIRVLPRKALALAAEVAIRSRRLEDRLAQIEALDNALRGQRKVLSHQFLELGSLA